MPPRRKFEIYCLECGEKITLKSGKYNKKFCSQKCCHKRWIRDKHPNWKGGQFIDKKGYVWIYYPKHPHRTNTGYVKRARIIIENRIKRYLLPLEEVHHINKNKSDDDIDNLLLVTKSQHAHIHFSEKRPNRRKYDSFYEFPKNIIIGKIITILPDYRTYIGYKCLNCGKKSWTRKYRSAKFCHPVCMKKYVENN